MGAGLPRLTGGGGKNPAPTTGQSQQSFSLPPLTGGGGASGYSLPPLTAATPGKASAPHHGGGFLSGIESVGHWVGQKTGLAAHDIKGIPGGLYDMAKTEGQAVSDDLHGRNKAVNRREWNDLLHGHVIRMFEEPKKGDATPAAAHNAQLLRGFAQGSKDSLQHPLRDPFQTFATVAPLLHSLGKAADVATGGRIAGAAAEPRLLKVGDSRVPLHGSTNPLARLAQNVYDKAMQHALDTNPEGRLAGHAVKRAAGSIAETERYRQRMRDVPANLLDDAARRLVKNKTPAARRIRQAALELTSVNTSPEDAAAYHAAQAAKGIASETNAKVAALYRKVADQQLLTHDAHGNVIVDATQHPALARADQQLAIVQHAGDKILADHGLMTKEGLAIRNNAPARVRAGAHFHTAPTPEAAKEAAKLEQAGQLSLAPRTESEQVGTGFIGGGTARPGRGFVSYKTAEPKASKSPVARFRRPVIGAPKMPITSHEFTGAGIEQGAVPRNVTRSAAQHMRMLNRFVNTDELRAQLRQTGSDVRRTSHDVLIRDPEQKAAKLSQETQQLLGKTTSTTDTPEELQAHLEDAQLKGKLAEYRNHVLPGLKNEFADDKKAAIGMKAEPGFRWVDERTLKPLTEDPAPRGLPGKVADKLNSLVTSATVYLKPGHVGTRILTNLATNVIHGSWDHAIKNHALYDQLSEGDRARVLAAAGQHGFQAMPHEGSGPIAALATHGANWWAKHADQAFRWNIFLDEARKAGYDTPGKIGQLLDGLQSHGEGLDAATWTKMDWIAKRSNRAGIAYDRLNPAERRYLARYVWFYPWIKGSVMFTGHTAVEHPYKTAALGAAGVQGRQQQETALGKLPSYMEGLIPLDHGGRPLTTDFSTFSPFATSADVLHLGGPGKAADFLNPAYGSLVQAMTHQNSFGQHSNHPYTDAVSNLFSPAPEAQIIGAAMHPHNGVYRTTPFSAFLRAMLGPATPRRVNLAKAHKAYGLELKGR